MNILYMNILYITVNIYLKSNKTNKVLFFFSSSAVEQSAVNRLVVGSNPA